MNLQSKSGYCIITQSLNITVTFFVNVRKLRTHRRTDKRADGRSDYYCRCPQGTFRPVHKIFLVMSNILEILFPEMHILTNPGVLSKGDIISKYILVHASDEMNWEIGCNYHYTVYRECFAWV